MIKQDRGETTSRGDSNVKLSELALLTMVIIEMLSEETGVSYDDITLDLEKSIQVNRLVKKGMSVEEAIEVTGLNVENIIKDEK